MATPSPGARASELIETLRMQPHPEGGYYAEVYRSLQFVAPQDDRPARSAMTGIYFLLVDRGASCWHRVRSDEVWCHLEGAPVTLHQCDLPAGRVWHARLAPVSADARPQATVRAGVWQAAQCEGEHSLVACFVAPGFEFADFEMMSPDDAAAHWLRQHHPALCPWIAGR